MGKGEKRPIPGTNPAWNRNLPEGPIIHLWMTMVIHMIMDGISTKRMMTKKSRMMKTLVGMN